MGGSEESGGGGVSDPPIKTLGRQEISSQVLDKMGNGLLLAGAYKFLG